MGLWPALVAVLFSSITLVSVGVFLLAAQYHRYGQLRWGRTALVAASVVYAFAVGTYTQLPLPATRAESCRMNSGGLDLNPLNLFRDISHALALNSGALGDVQFRQIVLNVVLFVPLGFLAVKALGARAGSAVGFGLLTSVLIEVTQYTGIFGLYCSYRVADIADVMTNTLGALIGALLAISPLLRWVPTPRQLDAAERRRPVTRVRRLWGILFDLAFAQGVIAVTSFGLEMLGRLLDVGQRSGWQVGSDLAVLVAVLVLVVRPVMLPGRGSLGLRCVWIDVVRRDGSPASLAQGLLRSLAGTGGFALLMVLDHLTSLPGLTIAQSLWALVTLVVLVRDPSGAGLSFTVSGTVPRARGPQPHAWA